MTDTIRNQILAVCATGQTNMFAVKSVQRLAYEMDYFELVNFIDEHRDEYTRFIANGDTTKAISPQ